MAAFKHLFGFVLFAFGIVTLVGMGFLTKAVLDMSTSKMTCYPMPTVAPTAAPTAAPAAPAAPKAAFEDIKEVAIIDLNKDQIIVAKISVVCFWILLFFSIFGIKLFF